MILFKKILDYKSSNLFSFGTKMIIEKIQWSADEINTPVGPVLRQREKVLPSPSPVNSQSTPSRLSINVEAKRKLLSDPPSAIDTEA